MATIFRVAAGIVIAYLLILIFTQQFYKRQMSQYEAPPSHIENQTLRSERDSFQPAVKKEKTREEADALRELEESKKIAEATEFIEAILQKSDYIKSRINSYYQKHGKIPKYVDDLDCESKDACAYSYSNGYFFIAHQDHWLAIKPYLIKSFIHYDCATSFNINRESHTLQGKLCHSISSNPLVEPLKPSFDCQKATTFVERAICASDKLSEIDMKMSSAYKHLESSCPDEAEKIKSEQNYFIKKREDSCKNNICIEEMTNNRIRELAKAKAC